MAQFAPDKLHDAALDKLIVDLAARTERLRVSFNRTRSVKLGEQYRRACGQLGKAKTVRSLRATPPAAKRESVQKKLAVEREAAQLARQAAGEPAPVSPLPAAQVAEGRELSRQFNEAVSRSGGAAPRRLRAAGVR